MTASPPQPVPPSLQRRLLAATLAFLSVALIAAGWLLAGLFRDIATQQFTDTLRTELDQLTARIDWQAPAEPAVDAAGLSDPRWQRPLSGLYWQIDGPGRAGALRSRSLWDATLALPGDAPAEGATHVHAATGPRQEPLLVVERTVHDPRRPDVRWRVAVAADTASLEAGADRFRGGLVLSLVVLFGLLALASWAQVRVGLSPLRPLRSALDTVRRGQAEQLPGHYPAELQPLVDDFNGVLAQNTALLERARQQAGNLAHAVKTPLAVLQQAAAELDAAANAPLPPAERAALAQRITEQVQLARRHIDWHLARARSAAQARPGRATAVAPAVQGLVRVMDRVHAGRGLRIATDLAAGTPAFQGEEQDLQEMLGNLLDNACKWAAASVVVRSERRAEAPGLRIAVEDDGPGIADALVASASQRGVRLDERVPGSGLGLSIVRDLVDLYGGRMALERSAAGGLRAVLDLPAAD